MPKTLRLNIPVLLPHAPDAQDGCVGRLIALMQAEAGVSEAHLVEGAEQPGVAAVPRVEPAHDACTRLGRCRS